MNVLEMAMAAKMGGGKGGGVSSWDELGKKTIEPVVFDGKLEGKDRIAANKEEDPNAEISGFVKVSDNVYSVEQMNGATITVCQYENGVLIRENESAVNFIIIDNVVVDEQFSLICFPDTEEHDFYGRILKAPSPGVYVNFYNGRMDGVPVLLIVEKITFPSQITPIPEEYLPGPTLLGEITLTGENTTLNAEDSAIRHFNDELQTQAKAIFKTIANTNTLIFVRVEYAGLVVQDAVSFSIDASGMDNKIAYGRGAMEGSMSESLSCCDPTYSAAIDTYPMTIKFYAVGGCGSSASLPHAEGGSF